METFLIIVMILSVLDEEFLLFVVAAIILISIHEPSVKPLDDCKLYAVWNNRAEFDCNGQHVFRDVTP